jgi:hypothetical protein
MFVDPETPHLDNSPSSMPSQKDQTYDKCHIDIQNLSDQAREDFANKYCKPPNIFICLEGQEIPINEPEFKNLKVWAKERGYLHKKGRLL